MVKLSLNILVSSLLVISVAGDTSTSLSQQDTSWRPIRSRALHECREVEPLSAAAFDIDKYTEKSWFIQKQQVNPYQGEESLYCVVATYVPKNGYIQVLNTANTDSVNGTQQTEVDPDCENLCANQIEGGSIQVAPCFFRYLLCFGLFAGPYWVLAVGDNYEWAIVSGGQPDVVKTVNATSGQTTCTTREDGCINGSGLWLFSRSSTYNQTQIDIQEAKLKEMGIFTEALKKVEHEGCTYPDFIKT